MSGCARWPQRHMGSLRLEPSSPGAGGQSASTCARCLGGQMALHRATCCTAQGQARDSPGLPPPGRRTPPPVPLPSASSQLPGYCLFPSPFLPSLSLGLATGLPKPLLGLASGPTPPLQLGRVNRDMRGDATLGKTLSWFSCRCLGGLGVGRASALWR